MMERIGHHWPVRTRREFFTRAGSGLAGIALASMVKQDGLMAAPAKVDPMAALRAE